MIRCLQFLDSLPSFQHYKRLIVEPHESAAGKRDCRSRLRTRLRRAAPRAAHWDAGARHRSRLERCAPRIGARDGLERRSRGIYSRRYSRSAFQGWLALDCCKVDRTLQHVEKPESVLREMFRTVRPGGRVVCAEPDWGTFTIEHENRMMVRRIAEFWGKSFRNLRIGRQLSNELREARFVDIDVQGTLLIAPSFDTADRVFDIVQPLAGMAKADGNNAPLEWFRRPENAIHRVPFGLR